MQGLIIFLIKDSFFLFELFKKGVSQHKIKKCRPNRVLYGDNETLPTKEYIFYLFGIYSF